MAQSRSIVNLLLTFSNNREQGMDVWTADAYVVATWLPPNNLDPSLSFPDHIAFKDAIVFPAWKPGHWMLCVMKPKDRQIYFLDSTNPYGLGDECYVHIFSKMTAKTAPGTWMLLKNKDVPQQIGYVDCGVFMLMYALHVVLGAPFDFTSHDFPKIRRWWVGTSVGQVTSKMTENLQKTLELHEEQATPSSSEELTIIKHMKLAVKWIHANRHVFRGPVEEPLFLRMEEDDKEKTLQNLIKDVEDCRDPFTFNFSFREDMEIFLVECHEKMGLQLNSSFEE